MMGLQQTSVTIFFVGYDDKEFKVLFHHKPIEWITTTGADGLLELIKKRSDFFLSDNEGQYACCQETYNIFHSRVFPVSWYFYVVAEAKDR